MQDEPLLCHLKQAKNTARKNCANFQGTAERCRVIVADSPDQTPRVEKGYVSEAEKTRGKGPAVTNTGNMP